MRVKRWRKPIYVIRDFNNQMKQLDLAEAVTVIRVLAFVIRSSEATTTMVLQRELKTASESPKKSRTAVVESKTAMQLSLTFLNVH
ncbi:hypothetical protein L2E82_05624 [Cichorium intybus]|uniref:Uncharacterized protein n=1 Tax=Cichorium intybus TaxID=13427 RepID=A0ACB9H8X5_CICIN|nr:hypothetical protein L2E82_05624 [Cichorium intybus]